jgi:hypothetical protein
MSFRSHLIHKIRTYYRETPTALKCLGYLENKYPFVKPTIDHTAYRFINRSDCNQFVKNADPQYVLGGHLVFPLKNTDKFPKEAYWYKHPFYSRMFVSFLDIKDNSIKDNGIKDNSIKDHDIKFIKSILDSNSTKLEKYNLLKNHDQYLAWTCTWGESINHLAFDLSLYPDPFEKIIEEMKDDLGLEMNQCNLNNPVNPLIMVSNDLLLQQASTKSDLVDGIPKAYIEFVHRSYDPLIGKPRDGFDTFSANGIFESTNFSQQAVS